MPTKRTPWMNRPCLHDSPARAALPDLATAAFWCLAMALACGLVPDVALADPSRDSSAPGNEDWNRFDEALALVEQTAASPVVRNEIDLGTLSPSDSLLLIAPAAPMPVQTLLRFMRSGGRLAVFDEGAALVPVLKAFDIQHTPHDSTLTIAPPRLRGNAALPVALPGDAHPTNQGVHALLMHRPRQLTRPSLAPLFRIGGTRGPGVALGGAVGQGRLLAFGDSSLLTDQQLRLPSHRRLLQNVTAYLERPEGQLWTLLPGGRLRGEFGQIREARWARLDRALARLSHPDLPTHQLQLLSFAALAILTIVALFALPLRSPYKRTSGPVDRGSTTRPGRSQHRTIAADRQAYVHAVRARIADALDLAELPDDQAVLSRSTELGKDPVALRDLLRDLKEVENGTSSPTKLRRIEELVASLQAERR